MEWWVCTTMSSSIHEMFSIFAQFQLQEQVNFFFKNNEKNEKKWKKQPWTLAYILVFQTMSFPLSSIFGPNQLNFLPKWCHVDTTSIWFHLALDPHPKALGLIYGSQPIGMLHFVGPWTLV
jgi:hypothetical protein